MKKMRKMAIVLPVLVLCAGTLFAQGAGEPKVELLISAAASLTDCMDELVSYYTERNPTIIIDCNYGSSGSLQQQIEQGAPADIFFSAGSKQMAALCEKGLMDDSTVKNVLNNTVVLIVPKDGEVLDSFESLLDDSVKRIGVGEPKSVPAGQYAEQVLQNLGLAEKLAGKLVLAKDVREVLSWVETGNVQAGVVYGTDAKISGKVTVCCSAPEGSHKPIIYPVGVVKSSKHPEEAGTFEEFLFSAHAKEVFSRYGFTVLK